MGSTADRLRRERDFYRRLLDLASTEAVEPFLEEALRLLCEAAGPRRGYLELRGPDHTWSLATALDDAQLDLVRASLSSGILSEALTTGETVVTVSALDDDRFQGRQSVQLHRIEAVLCAPVGQPPLGVVYLQTRTADGTFDQDDIRMVEDLALHLAPLAGRLLTPPAAGSADPTLPWRKRLDAGDFIGRSAAIAGVLEQVALVAPLDVDVLLTGESGTGKTEVARLIVANSRRAGGPFVELNGAAIPEQLVESELFGALPGSFTGASRRITGKVEAAEGGTLFLDEVGELPPPAQAKLLQFLQSRTFWPVGADRPSQADVRILAATNVDMQRAVADGTFREDLYWRLCVLPVRMPTLAERPEDLDALATHFLRTACRRLGLPAARLAPSALRAIHAAEWPGNVRQLANAVQAALIRSQADGGRQITARHLFPDTPAPDAEPQTWQEATRAFQRDLLARVLDEEGGNVSATARRLDLTRSHLYTLLDGFGLRRQGAP